MNRHPLLPAIPSFATPFAIAAFALCTQAAAHDFKVGSIVIDHPYATPTPPGATTGAVYFRNLRNTAQTADRLVRAESPVSRAVELHEMTLQGDVMRMRALDAVELPPGTTPAARQGGRWHLMLVDLKQPLREGDRFPVMLVFERSGRKEVVVWVQPPRGGRAESGSHSH
jgi:periplasmic copper chaperone A